MQVSLFNSIKEFFANIFKSRLNVLIALFCILTFILVQRLFVLQIVEGEDYLENYTLSIRKVKVIQGTRGNIYDRNGELLATNRISYTVQIEDNGSYENRTQKNEIINETINYTIDLIEKNGDVIVSDFGIILDKDDHYQFLYAEGTKRLRFLADVYGYATIDKLKEQGLEDSSPQDVMDFLCANKRKSDYGFGIDQKKYSKDRVLKLVTIRYDMHLNSFQKYIATTIASDVSTETVAVIKENMNELQGVSIGEVALREYPDSKYFASVLGYTGKISQEEYDALPKEKQKEYSLTDIVGKSGIEQMMDAYLQGEKGEEIVYVNSVGKVVETESVTEPKAGNDLYLTLDKELQITAYNLLEEKLAGIILRKMSNVLDYTRNPNGNASEVIIPAGDIYYSFIGNEILDTDHFAEEDATPTEKKVYQLYTNRQEKSIQKVIQNLESSSSPAYEDLTKEMQAYMNYIAADMLSSTGVLRKDKIDVNDDVYEAWKAEKINLNQYLNHAISKNWVDSSVVQNYLKSDGKYSDSTQLYQGILSYISDCLKTDSTFEKLVYRYMVKDGTLSGTMICVLLYDQQVLEYDETQYNRLLSGYSAYSFIRSKIESLEITPGQLGVEPSTGSVVMSDTNTGRTLVCVSYPGYDNNRLANKMDVGYYNQIYANTSLPFYNKATQELTAPGSTFKPLSAIAGLTEEVVTGKTTVNCMGPYENVSPSPTCWVYPSGHGYLNVVDGISNSCNCYFYEVGYRLGLNKKENYSSTRGVEKLEKYAKLFGLGEASGLEISERTPSISNEDSVRSSIGQGTHVYSTSQLTKYITGVANKGTVYNLTLLQKVVNQKGKVIKEYKPSVYNKVTEVNDKTYELVHDGMAKMVSSDSRFQKLKTAGIQLAGKTGTAQQSKTHANNVLFVGFAPINEPEIAFCIRITNGYNSGYTAEIGRDLTLKYFGKADDSELIFGKAGVLGAETNSD